MPARVSEGLWSADQKWIPITYAGHGPAEHTSSDARVQGTGHASVSRQSHFHHSSKGLPVLML